MHDHAHANQRVSTTLVRRGGQLPAPAFTARPPLGPSLHLSSLPVFHVSEGQSRRTCRRPLPLAANRAVQEAGVLCPMFYQQRACSCLERVEKLPRPWEKGSQHLPSQVCSCGLRAALSVIKGQTGFAAARLLCSSPLTASSPRRGRKKGLLTKP